MYCARTAEYQPIISKINHEFKQAPLAHLKKHVVKLRKSEEKCMWKNWERPLFVVIAGALLNVEHVVVTCFSYTAEKHVHENLAAFLWLLQIEYLDL